MIKEVILVPQDRCPLDVLAEMGEQTANSWIFLHENAVKKLRITADEDIDAGDFLLLTWEKTEKYPSTVFLLKKEPTWYQVRRIEATDIAFSGKSIDPQNIFFLKMEA